MSAINNGPHIAQSDNLAPWQWKRERAPRHQDPGGALKVSVNSTDPAPLLQDGQDSEVFQVGATESVKQILAPKAQGEIVASKDAPVKEDGK